MNTAKSLGLFQRAFRQAFRSRHVATIIPNLPATVRAFHIQPLLRHLSSSRVATARLTRRSYSTESQSESPSFPLSDRSSDPAQDSADADSIAMRKALSPAYQLWFTCKKCLERSGHTVSKQAYHFGTCVIHCPGCKSQHLISDHLKIFSDKAMTMEDIANEHGEKLRRGRLGADGDVEFYDDDATARLKERG